MAESNSTDDVEDSVNIGSEVTFDIVCFTCNSDDQIQEAEGYCLDCCEHLCASCLKYHTMFTATKHHKIIDKKNMPGKQSISSNGDICTERCQNHKDEIIKFFCSTHKVPGCSVCVTLKHKLCNDVTYIPEAAAKLSGSKELNDFQTNLKILIKKSENIIKATKSNIKLSDEYRTKALLEIENYRQELNEALNKRKEELEQQSEEIEKKETERMNYVADTSNQVLVELNRMSLEMNELLDKKKYCQMYVYMTNAEDKLKYIQDMIPKSEDIFATAVRFQPNLELQNLIQRDEALGSIFCTNPFEIKSTFLTDIDVTENSKECQVTSASLISQSKLVITDWDNKTVKLIDIDHNRIISEYKSETSPYDVTILDNNQVAVTLPESKKIQFLKSEDELGLDGEISFDAKCWHVSVVEGKLVVSFTDPWEVRLLNMAGEVLQTFATSRQRFSVAPYLSVSSFNQGIYASDWDENRVAMLDMDGNVRAVYEDADLKYPRQAAVDDTGMVYLCSTDSHSVHLLTPDCRKVKILLSEADGIRWPLGICFCKNTKRLYVGMYKYDKIKVFQLS